jgi:glycosyltransferase involved in cell wall biosynthesis
LPVDNPPAGTSPETLVLHVITSLNTGGAELMLLKLVGEQMAQGRYRHRVISLQTMGTVGSRLQALGVEVEALGMTGSLGLVRGFAGLVRRIREIRPDVLQTWMYHADLVAGLAGRLAGCRRILWGVRVAEMFPAMGVSRSAMWSRRLCALLSRRVPSRIVYVAESARSAHESLGYDRTKSVVIQNGYPVPSRAEIDAARTRRRAELGLDPGAVLIASAGRFSPQKGYESFVAAAAELAKRHPEARFLLAGRDVDRANPKLSDWVRASGIADRFHLIGETEALLEWLAASDVFVLYSLGEGFPNVVAEAMSVEVPCLVTDVGDSALLVADTGIVIRPRNLNGLTEGLERLMVAGESERRRLGEAARRRVETFFSLSAVAERYAKLYDELAEKSRDATAAARGDGLELR